MKLLDNIIDQKRHPIDDLEYRDSCKRTLDEQGVLVLPSFLTSKAIKDIVQEGMQSQPLAFYTVSDHNTYLKPTDPELAHDHPRNRLVSSSKGCITTDQIPVTSALRTMYGSDEIKKFLCAVLGESSLHEYADPLSSINLHYAAEGEELGWHFDNSSFAITLLIQKPEAGGVFQFVKDVRDADDGDMNYPTVGEILDGQLSVQTLSMDAGDLVLFRGRNSMHRVTPTIGETTRMLVVLAYNNVPGIALSESARMTFYGRLG